LAIIRRTSNQTILQQVIPNSLSTELRNLWIITHHSRHTPFNNRTRMTQRRLFISKIKRSKTLDSQRQPPGDHLFIINIRQVFIVSQRAEKQTVEFGRDVFRS